MELNEVKKMDIEIYQNGEYVNTCYDIADYESALLEFLCSFCRNEGYCIGSAERDALQDCICELVAGEMVSLCGFELKLCE